MRNKRGMLDWVILIIVLLLVGGIFLFQNLNKEVNEGDKECEIDEDCIAASCCHPNSCVPKEQAPNCSGVYCSAVCEPETLDCGQGECKCVKSKCGAAMK